MAWLRLLLNWLLIAVVYLATLIVGNSVLEAGVPPPPPEQMGGVVPGLLLTAGVDAAIITLLILGARWSGPKLMAAVAFSLYGVMTVMAMIEAAYFGPALGIRPEWLPGLTASSIPAVVISVPFAVWVLGRARAVPDPAPNARLVMPVGQWLWKMAVIAFLYVVLYAGFGQVVAWSNPALREMYGGGLDPQIFDPVKMLVLQIFRAGLWVLFGAPVIRMTKGSAWQGAVVLGLLYALPMNIVHFTPNSIMPDPSVRLSHFIETASSNFIFGLLVFWLLHRRHGRGGAGPVGRAARPS